MEEWITAGIAELRIMNWEKHQAEGRRYESTSWFRLDNDLPLHELWEELDGEEFKAMIGLFCYVSQKHHKTGFAPRVRLTTLERFTGMRRAVIVSTLRKLSSPGLGIAEVKPCSHGAAPVQEPSTHGDETALRYDTIRNGTNETEEEETSSSTSRPDEDGDTKGPVSELRDVDVGDFLDDVSHRGQRRWISAFALPFVRTHLLECASKWESHTDRSKRGAKALFVHSWLANEKQKAARASPATAPPAPSTRATGHVIREANERAAMAAKVLADPEKVARIREMAAKITGRDKAAGGD